MFLPIFKQKAPYKLMERSIFSSRYCFVENLFRRFEWLFLTLFPVQLHFHITKTLTMEKRYSYKFLHTRFTFFCLWLILCLAALKLRTLFIFFSGKMTKLEYRVISEYFDWLDANVQLKPNLIGKYSTYITLINIKYGTPEDVILNNGYFSLPYISVQERSVP